MLFINRVMLFLYDFQYGSRSPYLAVDLLIDTADTDARADQESDLFGNSCSMGYIQIWSFLLKPDWVFDFGIKPLG